MTVAIEVEGPVWTIAIDRPAVRNAVDGPTAQALARAFRTFDAEPQARVAILTGRGGTFCAGADLKAFASSLGGESLTNPLSHNMGEAGPMGPTRLVLSKPVIAAVAGHAVAGGMELALWCDLRVVEEDAVFGIFCRRFGVPLIDGGTVRLPHLIGMSRALDLILTGRPVDAHEALAIGLANRVVARTTAHAAALSLAQELAALPQTCLRGDRASTYGQIGLPLEDALAAEFARGMKVLAAGEAVAGAQAFADGSGRHGEARQPRSSPGSPEGTGSQSA